MDRHIYEVFGTDAVEMTMSLMEKANIAAEIPASASIALKPNLVVGKEPSSGATTHGGILEGAIRYMQAHGHKNISIIEGSWVGDRTERGFRACGYDAIGKRYGVPLYDLKKDKTRTVQTHIGSMDICVRALEADYLISLPVLKGHCQTTMTCCLKSNKGCLPDSEKRRFHSLGLHEPIAALAAKLKPSLYIVDSICGDLNFEEGGTPVQTNRMLLGRDPVQLDAYGCSLMGVDIPAVDYIGYAEKWGAGSSAFTEADIVRLNSPDDAASDYPRPSGMVARLTKNVEQRSACSACFGNLTHALYRMEHEYHQTCKEHISIGQGFRDMPCEGIGIGRCCMNAEKCVMGCPPSANDIINALLEE